MAFLSPEMAAQLRGLGQGLLSQSFTKLPQTGFEGLGAGIGFAEQNMQALQRQQLAQQQAAAQTQQRGITNQLNQDRLGISQSQLGISQGQLGVSQGSLAVQQGQLGVKESENRREQKAFDTQQDLFKNMLDFSKGGAPVIAPGAPPPPAPPTPAPEPGPLSQAAPPPQPGPVAQAGGAPAPPAAIPPQAPPGPVMTDAGPDIPLRGGMQLASLQQPQGFEQPVTQGRVVPEIAARHRPDQRLAQAAQPVPHPDPSARAIKTQEPTFMGMNRQQAGEFVRIKTMLGDASAASYLRNIQTRQDKAAERGTLSLKEKFVVEDRMHDDFIKRINVAKYNEASALYDGMRETVNDPSGQADVDLIFATANILDPGSVVREGEAATVFQSGGAGAWAQNFAGWLASGNRLSAKDRAALLRIADRRVRSYLKPASRAAARAEALAKRRGLSPGGVVRTDYSGKNHRAPIKAEDMHPDVQGIFSDPDRPSLTIQGKQRTAPPRGAARRGAAPPAALTMSPAQMKQLLDEMRKIK